VNAHLDEWGLAAKPVKVGAPVVPKSAPIVIPPGPTQTVTITDGGAATLAPAPAGTILLLTMPPKASSATVLWNRGVSQITEGCYDMSGPCSLVLDGNPGSILISWDVAPVSIPGQPPTVVPQPPPFTITIPGEAAQSGQLIPPITPPFVLKPGTILALPTNQGTKAGGAAPCPSGWAKDTVTGACLPACWNGSAQASGVCPPNPSNPNAPTTSTGTYVAVGAGVLALGGAAWWYWQKTR
jgi:hypothetical protein